MMERRPEDGGMLNILTIATPVINIQLFPRLLITRILTPPSRENKGQAKIKAFTVLKNFRLRIIVYSHYKDVSCIKFNLISVYDFFKKNRYPILMSPVELYFFSNEGKFRDDPF